MMRRALLAVPALCVLLAPAAASAAPRVAFRITDPRITEASGIAPGQRWPGVAYVQNDSGDTNRVFAVSTRTGGTVATLQVAGATNVDWEDLAVARDAAGTPSLWIADTGDNDGERDAVQVYRVDEPASGAGDVTTGRADVWRLRYPNGPGDAEALAVAPGGAAYLVTKEYLGRSTVYRVPARPSGRVQVVRAVATLSFGTTGTRGGPAQLGSLAQLAVTGAAFSRDGAAFVVRTYTDAYVWPVRDGDLAAALRAQPTRIALPRQPQGEGVAFGGGGLLVDSEGSDQPVYRVAVPAAATAAAEPTPSSSRAAAPSGSPSNRPSDPADDEATSPGNLRFVIGGGVVIVLAGALYLVLHRRHGRQRPE